MLLSANDQNYIADFVPLNKNELTQFGIMVNIGLEFRMELDLGRGMQVDNLHPSYYLQILLICLTYILFFHFYTSFNRFNYY